MRRFICAILLGLCVSMSGMSVAYSAEAGIEPFVGRYIGHSISNMADQTSDRDFDVSITSEEERGFEVSWTTFIHRSDGAVKKKVSTISFRKTSRPGVYASAQKKDMFGNQVPHDPMQGDPYVWARLDGDTLSVYGFLVTDDGGYEMHSYHRTLTATGLDLEFTRQRGGTVIRRISGELRRVEN